ncbi:chorismate mutase [Croceicoccus bisphenolivorans]|uniref:chorismate mutase n=1 Tax=Croceicoccus bisphenolivorans TaxID=1783232 RepID=UPI000829A09D|nr:chorismate mutase [Croceicoccus bisphenolivorans]
MTDTTDATIKRAQDCETMTEVRAGVDATDRALMELLSVRFGYMRAAARIKQSRDAVRDEDRKQAVIDAAKAAALENGVPVGFVALAWEELVETSIAYELEEWERLRA